ncbi:MAG: DUF3137 domain-containing protein [Meiothermus sp.]|uniref:DUF3137 domain-containing protein n=1 Tax=Meiothermus sp. TaxID=1955249 RepID=UPI00298F1F31|nr:DUF3137 domain-containing protein [Meiothermus sp.]MCX7741142.1 DUF3137 domain-containing protein [Meiothermus sp.]MDW8091998.1 DUF3137 domain-containing protein [Meiothermus sp.]
MEQKALQELEKKLAPLEARRKRELLLAGGLFLLTPLWAYLLTPPLAHLGPLGVLWPILSALPAVYASLRLWRLRAELKEALLEPLAEALGYRYTPYLGLPQEVAYASGLLAPADRYEGEDLLEGEVRGFPFRSGDLALYRRVRTRNSTDYRRVFSGTLYRFALPFSIPGPVRLFPQGGGERAGEASPLAVLILSLPFLLFGLFALLSFQDAAAKAVGGFFILASSLPLLALLAGRRRGERVALESPAFEALFEVRGEDQVGARRLLTPRVQEALTGLRRRLGKPLWLSFREGEAWLLVGGGDRFEPSLLQPLNRGTLQAYAYRWTRELGEAGRFLEALGLELEARKRGLLEEGKRP